MQIQSKKKRTVPSWIGFLIGVLVFALPLAGYLWIREVSKESSDRKADQSMDRSGRSASRAESPEGSVAPQGSLEPGPSAARGPEGAPGRARAAPPFDVDPSNLIPSGASIPDPGAPPDPAALRLALGRVESWLRIFTIDPFGGAGTDSLRLFALEVDCWNHLWTAERDPARRRALDAAVRERLMRVLDTDRLEARFQRQDRPQGLLELLFLAADCRDHGVDPGPLISTIRACSSFLAQEMDRLPPSTAALYAAHVAFLGIDLHRPVSMYRSRGLLAEQPREAEMNLGQVPALTQEILAYTNAGRTPLRGLTAQERAYLNRVLPFYAMSYTLLQAPEVVGDILSSLRLAGLTDSYGYREAMRVLLSRQRPDGAFGALPPDQRDPRLLLAPTSSCAGALSRELHESPL